MSLTTGVNLKYNGRVYTTDKVNQIMFPAHFIESYTKNKNSLSLYRDERIKCNRYQKPDGSDAPIKA